MTTSDNLNESIEQEIPTFWTLYVKQLTGDRLRIDDIDPHSTVLDFKIKVGEVINIGVERQRMIFRGKVLENPKSLVEYGITDNSCIHLLKRAENQNTERTNTSNSTRRTNFVERRQAQGLGFDAGDLSRIINQQLRRTTGNNSRRLGRPFATGDNVEHIYQDLATLETLEHHFDQRRSRLRNRQNQSIPDTQAILHCLDDQPLISTDSNNEEELKDEEYGEEKVSSIDGVHAYFEQANSRNDVSQFRQFQVGQWIDCLDTVNQWLEATITHISEDRRRVRVHYNGWGTRWDETIDVNSPRIARFRTKSKNKAQCRNFSPTLNHWVNHTPKLNQSNDLQNLSQAVYKASEPILAQLRRVTNDEYGDCHSFEEATDAKRQDVIELAPKLDLLGRAIADLGRSFANRPNFKRRQDYLKQTNSLIQLVRVPLIPLGMKTSVERDRKVNGEWNTKENEELLRNLEYDEQLVKLAHSPNIVHSRSRNSRNVELHLHAIVASSDLRPQGQGGRTEPTTTTTQNLETQSERDRQELADAGVRDLEDLDELNAAYDRRNNGEVEEEQSLNEVE